MIKNLWFRSTVVVIFFLILFAECVSAQLQQIQKKPSVEQKIKPAGEQLKPVQSKKVSTVKETETKVSQFQPGGMQTFSINHVVELKVSLETVVDPKIPAGSGEFPTKFMEEGAIAKEYYDRDHVYMAFRYKSAAPGVKGVEWQVARFASSAGMDGWKYPDGLLASGMVLGSIPAPGQNGYLTIDFRSILNLPSGYIFPRPVPAHSKSQPGVSAFSSYSFHNPSQKIKLTETNTAMHLQYQQKAGLFKGAMSAIAKQMNYYVRVVLLGDDNKPIGLSHWVTLRPAAPSEIVVYMNSLPSATQPSNVIAPDVKLASYSGPIVFSPEDNAYRFVVLGNVPEFIKTHFNWKPGDKLFLKPSKDDDNWLDKAGDALGSVFSVFEDFINFLSKTWDELKNQLINAVCFGSADCAKYAMPILNTGLMYLGIPPELPNFNDLASMGADYLASYVAAQTNLPEDAIRVGLEKMGDLVNNPPSGSGSFLWPDPDFQNRPAVLWVEVNNTHPVPTDPVMIDLRYGSTLGDATHYPPKLATFLDTSTPVPPLRPGQKIKVPIFLTENPEIGISHGADSKADYYKRKIIIYNREGTILFSSSENWRKQDVTNSIK